MVTIMTVEEVAEFLRVHPSTVYRLLKRHSIPAFKMGSDWRFNRESIEKWVVECEVASGVGNTHAPGTLQTTGGQSLGSLKKRTASSGAGRRLKATESSKSRLSKTDGESA